MTFGVTSPSAEEFAALDQPLVPVVRRLLADGETAVGVYRKLAGNRPGTFLLESAEQGKQWSRWSFVGVRCAGGPHRARRQVAVAGRRRRTSTGPARGAARGRRAAALARVDPGCRR